MAPVKFNRIISYSSEDPIHKAENLLNPDSTKKWKCKDKGESESVVVLELHQQLKISSLDIGNEFSAFVKVLVGKSCSDEYKTLLPTVSMMGPQESKTGVNTNSVRFFKEDSFLNTKDTWDKIKVVCTQPYNKCVQYGIAFITVHSNDLNKEEIIPTPTSTTDSVNKNSDLNKTDSPKEAFTVSYKNGQFTTYLEDEPALKPAGYFFAKRKQLMSPPRENIKIPKLDPENEKVKNDSIKKNAKKDVNTTTDQIKEASTDSIDTSNNSTGNSPSTSTSITYIYANTLKRPSTSISPILRLFGMRPSNNKATDQIKEASTDSIGTSNNSIGNTIPVNNADTTSTTNEFKLLLLSRLFLIVLSMMILILMMKHSMQIISKKSKV